MYRQAKTKGESERQKLTWLDRLRFRNKSPLELKELKVFRAAVGGSWVRLGGRKVFGGLYGDYGDPPMGWYPNPLDFNFDALEVELEFEDYPYDFQWPFTIDPTIEDLDRWGLWFYLAESCGLRKSYELS